VIVTGTVIEHPFASVTVKVYEPAVKLVCAGVIVYGPVPPFGVIITDPVLAPLHNTLVMAVVAVKAAGSVMVTGTVIEHPFASVTVKVCSPALRLVCAGVIVYGPVPPEGVIITDPVLPPLHNTLLMAVVAVNAAGSVTVTGTVKVQPFASVTVKVYAPAVKLVCAGVIEYGPTPPAGVTTTDPVLPPLHKTLVTVAVAVMPDVLLIVTGTLIEQPFASVTVKVYAPAARLVCAGVIVYGPVPPEGVIITDPVLPPLHCTPVITVVTIIAAGSVIVTGTVIEHPFASVTVKVYEPAVKLVCAGVIV